MSTDTAPSTEQSATPRREARRRSWWHRLRPKCGRRRGPGVRLVANPACAICGGPTHLPTQAVRATVQFWHLACLKRPPGDPADVAEDTAS